MLLAEIAATLWFLAFGALVNIGRDKTELSNRRYALTCLLVFVCLVLSTIVIARIFIRGLL